MSKAGIIHGLRQLLVCPRPSVCVLASRYISKKQYPWPELNEADIEEKLIRGHGPGGQAVAKTSNCVQIKHIPTGIVVKNHETRSATKNRQLAHEILINKLDILYNKENSFHAIQQRERADKERKSKAKAEKLRQIKKEFKLKHSGKQEMTTAESEGFMVVKDYYGGLELHTKSQTFTSTEEYDAKLAVALPKWQSEKIRGFWAKISLEHAHLAGVFAKHGLDFHHAQSGYVMMAKWLSTSEPSMIPEYANQYLGVAGFVINEKNQLLVIQEKYNPFTNTAKWKLPGGHADKGEEISDTAKREVLEETGIEAEFVGVIAFRHQLGYRYGTADFYFICLMKPTNPDQQINKCDQEIAACKWLDLDEYLRSDITDANRYFAQCYKDGLVNGNHLITATRVNSYNKKTMHNIYSIGKHSDREHS